MGQCVEKLPHKCGSSDGLQVFEQEDGTYNGYCYACNTFEPDPYKEKPVGYKPKFKRKSPEEIQAEIEEVKTYQTVDLQDRALKKEYLEYFDVKVGVSGEDGITPASHYYPYFKQGNLEGYKVRLIENKRMWSIGNQKDVDLFGWDQAVASGAKRLLITEGELDAVALFQVLKDNNKNDERYKDFNPAVCSLPHGSGSAGRDIARQLTEINHHFKEVVLAFDMDEAGKKAASEVTKLLPNAMVAELPGKDANDCLLQGRKKALISSVIWKATKPKNTRLVWGSDLHTKAREEAPWGVSYPWTWLTEKTRGCRKGETLYLGAAQKMGKSEFVNALAAWFIKEHKWKVLLAKPEEGNKKSYKMVAGKVAGKIFHDPKIEFDYEAYDEAGKVLKERLCMLDLYQHLGWETLKEDILSAASEGIDAVFIDPITNLTNGMNPSEANTKLQEIAQTLASMAKDLDIAIFIFCHLRNPESGLPHDRGGAVLTSQFAGSRAMGRSCNYMFGLEGNKDPDLSKEERNIRDLVLLDDREYGEVGRCKLYWDDKTSLFNEM